MQTNAQQQLPQFDLGESLRHKEIAITKAAEGNAALLVEAREIARELAANGREISADTVVAEMCRRGHGIHSLGNAAGGLFRGRDWRHTGREIKSSRIHAHGNKIGVWKFVGKK